MNVQTHYVSYNGSASGDYILRVVYVRQSENVAQVLREVSAELRSQGYKVRRVPVENYPQSGRSAETLRWLTAGR